ncbi:MAG TPA: four helix bundle protein [Chthoniobacterales bacterium]|jgi:four helix bundle protein|nr:four helix bundle protein [Chthoniobacterales bacterium]
MTTPPYFDHEKLDVYRHSIAFCGWVGNFLPSIIHKTAAKDQLDRASTSIPLNIAEGNGKFSVKDRARFLEMARGSALECAACLDVLVARKLATEEQVADPKRQLAAIVRMMIGLLKRFSERADVLRDEGAIYGYDRDQEHDQGHEQEEKK